MSEHSHDELSLKSLYFAVALTLLIFITEIIGGFYSNSLSLVSDAVHMFFDAFSLILAILAITVSCRIPNKKITFGWHRAEILASLINGTLLMIVSLNILNASFRRLFTPAEILGAPMLAVAIIGFIANIIVLKKFHVHNDLTMKSAYFHVLSDTLTSVAVIVGAVIISVTNFFWIDSVLGIVIGLFIILQSIKVISESVRILIQGTPEGLDTDKIIEELLKIKRILDVHYVHAWALCSKINVLSAHIVTDYKTLNECDGLLNEINDKLKKFDINYSTIQFEPEDRKGRGTKYKHLTHEHKH